MRPPSTRSYRRRWRVIPPPLRSAGPSIEGIEILEEVPGGLGFALWQLVRALRRWVVTPEALLPSMFDPDAALRIRAEIVSLGLPLAEETLLCELSEVVETPAAVRRELMALRLRRVGEWMGSRGWPRTGRTFTELAVQTVPHDAETALALARQTRDAGDLDTADAWYQHSIMLARQLRHWEPYVLAWIGRGKIALRRGRLPAARRAATKARRTAQRRGLRTLEAWALHDLFVLAVHGGEYAQAEAYAHDAARAYPKGDPYLAVLSHDLAYLWMEKGYFDRAVAVFTALVPRLDALPSHAAHVWSNLARAAGGQGDLGVFDHAFQEWKRYACEDAPLESYLDVARGALSLARWDVATVVAEDARRQATAAGEHKTVFEAESLLQQAATEQLVRVERASESIFSEGEEVVEALVGALATV